MKHRLTMEQIYGLLWTLKSGGAILYCGPQEQKSGGEAWSIPVIISPSIALFIVLFILDNHVLHC